MRKKLIAGNWKMNKTSGEAAEFIRELAPKLNNSVDVVFCVPFTAIQTSSQALKGYPFGLGAQNMHFEDSGAFTGEISAKMLVEAGVGYVIIGHSERRQFFAETAETVNKKTLCAFANGLIPIVCVGENLAQREQGITNDLVRLQTKIAFRELSADNAVKAIVAYEPVWAIGTGKTATNAQAEEVCAVIRQVLSEIYDQNIADSVRILYGGSVNKGNAKDLFAMPNIDGGLVGGSSLKLEFADIVNYSDL